MSIAKQTPFLGSYQYLYDFYAKDVKDQILMHHYLGIACLHKMGRLEEAKELTKFTLMIINRGRKECVKKRLKELKKISNSKCDNCDNFLYIKRSKEMF